MNQADQFGPHLEVVVYSYFLEGGVVGVVVVDFDEQFVVDE